MNLGNIFRPIAQQIVNAALPAIKAELLMLISSRLSAKLPATEALVATQEVSAGLDAWTIKL